MTSIPGVKINKAKSKSTSKSMQHGYGTNYGTRFTKETMYVEKKGFSRKALGLGVAAGFVGGAALGAVGTMATYGVYHRYIAYRNMMQAKGFESYESDTKFQLYDILNRNKAEVNNYATYYESNKCLEGCPEDSHCEWGICECNFGTTKKYGRCFSGYISPHESSSYSIRKPCLSTSTCQVSYDINMICIKEGFMSNCHCKPDMKFNPAVGECQIYIDVNCTAFTYETPPSPLILDSITTKKNFPTATMLKNETKSSENTTLHEISKDINFDNLMNNQTSEHGNEEESSWPNYKTPTVEESLSNSLLTKLDKDKATEDDITEAFCRDVDSFNFDMNTYDGKKDPSLLDGKPSNCEEIPEVACGVAYDSSSCSGGWAIYLEEGGISFPYFSSYWKYRNDIDLLGVRGGCELIAFSDTEFSGRNETFLAEYIDQWWVLSEHPEFSHLDENIESIFCICDE